MLQTLRVETIPAYEVIVGPDAACELAGRTSSFTSCAVLTDEFVELFYAHELAPKGVPLLAVPCGEDSKSLAELGRVLDFLAEAGLDRKACLIALGGGVIGDLGGLAASLYMRGIAFAQVPTTLLAQVDSSVGGKTAINLKAGKNLAGTFHQPCVVLSDTRVLATLSDADYRSGLGEVLKTALLDGEEFLTLLEREVPRILAIDHDLLAEIVARCVRLKASIVARDPHEQHERKALNLGHTFAHAIEHEAGYGVVPHGIAVGVGLVLAAELSQEIGLSKAPELPTRIARLLARLAMPASLGALDQLFGTRLTPTGLCAAMARDKKNTAGEISFVLLEKLQATRIDARAPRELLEAVLVASSTR